MAVRKFRFQFHTNKVGSDIETIAEIELDDDLTDEQVNNEVIEAWVWENTYQKIEEVKEYRWLKIIAKLKTH